MTEKNISFVCPVCLRPSRPESEITFGKVYRCDACRGLTAAAEASPGKTCPFCHRGTLQEDTGDGLLHAGKLCSSCARQLPPDHIYWIYAPAHRVIVAPVELLDESYREQARKRGLVYVSRQVALFLLSCGAGGSNTADLADEGP